MKESDLYAKYIIAGRNGDKKEIERMLQMGFRPDKQRLFELQNCNEGLRNVLLNRTITIHIDMGSVAGHVYGEFPIYNEERTTISAELLGFYPKSDHGVSALVGEGVVLNENLDTKRVHENFQTTQVKLRISEEAWVRLAEWTTSKRKEKNFYTITSNNCVSFVHAALIIAGFSDGLVDKFDVATVNKMKFKPVKLELNHYLRFDKLDQYMPLLNQVFQSQIEVFQGGSYDRLCKEAVRKRIEAENFTRQNFVNGFFERYHDVGFYQRLFKDKPLSYEDITWLLKNHAKGLGNSIQAGLVRTNGQPSETDYRLFNLDVAGSLLNPAITEFDRRVVIIQTYGNKNRILVDLQLTGFKFCQIGIASLTPTIFNITAVQPLILQTESSLERIRQNRNREAKASFAAKSKSFSRDCEQSLSAFKSKVQNEMKAMVLTNPKKATCEPFVAKRDLNVQGQEKGLLRDRMLRGLMIGGFDKNATKYLADQKKRIENQTALSKVATTRVIPLSTAENGLNLRKKCSGWEIAALRLHQMQVSKNAPVFNEGQKLIPNNTSLLQWTMRSALDLTNFKGLSTSHSELAKTKLKVLVAHK